MTHFNKNTLGSKIHTTKGGGPCPHAKANRPPGGRANCNYRKISGGLAYSPWEAHHVLCVEAINRYGEIRTYKAYVIKIEKCYLMTDWCINQKANMLAMPRKSTYLKKKNHPSVLSLNIPCHDWDHNCIDGYFDEVVEALDEKIWAPIKKAVDKAKADKKHFNKYAVQQELEDLEKEFQEKLAKRGKRKGGTDKGWENKHSNKKHWWLPFSMAKDAVAMDRSVFSF
ncbi:hypothetical protein KYC5002_47755 [Archangium violaceum]|uniref:hypothetical protein n=1 Tax=Archangium violaceum TaxID=83451 RepID=UPI002B27F5F5|nr:hypothetical protein KYC5002_47755 [Archangium gephyra]